MFKLNLKYQDILVKITVSKLVTLIINKENVLNKIELYN